MSPPLPALAFDLSHADLTHLHRTYAPRANVAHFAQKFAAPFDATRFGDLEAEVGPDAAPKVIASLLANAKRGLSPDALAARFVEEMERHAEAWDAQIPHLPAPLAARLAAVTPRLAGGPLRCGLSVSADSGDFRVEVRAFRVPALLISYGSIKVKHFERDRKGRFDEARADHLEASGTVFLGAVGGPVQAIAVSKQESNSKKVRAQFVYAGLATIPFVEGCGGTSPNGALWACACSGRKDAVDQGGGGDGGPGGDGGIIDGG